VNVLRIIPNAAIKFSCNDAYKKMMLPAAGVADARLLPVGLALDVTVILTPPYMSYFRKYMCIFH
jgi:hypothetical protein